MPNEMENTNYKNTNPQVQGGTEEYNYPEMEENRTIHARSNAEHDSPGNANA